MVIYINKRIKKFNLNFSLRILKNPYKYMISNNFGYDAERINKDILKFIKVFEKRFKEENLKLYRTNIVSLYVEASDELTTSYGEAEYDIEGNRIIIKDFSKFTVFHELMHMASSNGINTGFEQTIDGWLYNRGLNEGYTDFLTNRYFGKKKDFASGYAIEVEFARMIEEIVGRELMESFYFNCNGLALEEELDKYFGENTNNLLDLIDSIQQTRREKDFSKKELEKKMQQVIIYIIEAYIKKQYMLYKDGKISIYQVRENINSFKDEIPLVDIGCKYITGDILYKVLDNNLQGIEKKIKK